MASQNALRRLRGGDDLPVRAYLTLRRSQNREWCGLCGEELLGRARLEVFKCSDCEQSYHQDCIDQLRRQEADRGAPLPFGCPGCGRPWYETSRPRFRQERTSGRYQYRMEGRTFICEGGLLPNGQQCAYTTTNNSSFYRHYGNVHESQHLQESGTCFSCPYCGHSLPTEESLMRHCRAAHFDRELPTAGTSYRQRDDPRSAARDSHSPRNAGSTYQSAEDGEYYCPRCAAGPFDYSRVLNHLTIYHNGEQPYCELCGQSFYAWRFLLRHLREDH
ncbi:uncharacterized protein BO95DRAFT_436567 [Aspergillus brunneoviolaceus CBS 621.78]|uniref:Uncharacterized protein n=1 Tax=Aspergillus brunneoviolaceus CBS 621.78 TaxID=1450534 RepID=A0ACD1FUA9_9EURO|nr:hypothetical protein BO95DRAFT_436567 [Aspergillus brunneoviolaceus CBS 621.78]RAH40587.1 hypothetical protein BO95DRAFT_436567 [Aspergillus brunneoviolaceus CBS 621.78]